MILNSKNKNCEIFIKNTNFDYSSDFHRQELIIREKKKKKLFESTKENCKKNFHQFPGKKE
jgi:hypothetical protein